jgi:co-chaperonin GroES (HSP10)
MTSAGILPIEHKVLLKPVTVEEKFAGTSLYKPTSTQEQEKWATVKGTVIAVSGLAFNYATPQEYEALGGLKPKVGDVVYYAKHAGVWIKADDGEEYLMVNDQDILAVAA